MTAILARLSRHLSQLRRPSPPRAARWNTRWLETLEDRTLLSAPPTLTFPFPEGVTPNVFIVTTTANPTSAQLAGDLNGNLSFKTDAAYGTSVAFNKDGTPISLYEAGSYADDFPSSSGDDIYFDVPGKGPFVFNLPFQDGYQGVFLDNGNLSINGWTQGNLPNHKATSQALVNTSATGDDAKIMIQINDRIDVDSGFDSIVGVSVEGIDMGDYLGDGSALIQGNFIGVTPSGASMHAIQEGISIGQSPNGGYPSNDNSIGGSLLAERNLIADHTDTHPVGGASVGNGIGIYNGSTGNLIQNNLIEGNLYGIHFDGTHTNNNLIGGTGEGNIITGNTQIGIYAQGGTSNSFTDNSIFDNGSAPAQAGTFGIVLAPGANNNIAAPVLEAFDSQTGVLSGNLPGSTPGSSYILEFYVNNDRDAAGRFEGETPFASVSITPDAQGNFDTPLASPSAEALTATVTDLNANTSAFSNTIASPLIATAGPTVRPVEGKTLSNFLVGTFSDSNPNADFQATVDWGDGSPAAVLTGADSADGQLFSLGKDQFTVHGAHKYAEAGPYDIHVVVEDMDSKASDGFTTHVEVAEADLTPVPLVLDAVEGMPLVGDIGEFTDLDSTRGPDAYTATVDWGDGSQVSSGTVVEDSQGHFHVEVTGGHVYSEENSKGLITITITEPDIDPVPSIEIKSPVDIKDAPLHLTPNALIHQLTGVKFTDTIATFTDEDPGRNVIDYSATIEWGDGTPTTVTNAQSPNGQIVPDATDPTRFDILGTHTYKEQMFPGYAISVTVKDKGGATDMGDATAEIDDPPLAAVPVTFSPVEGKSFKGVVAQINDPNFFAKPTDFTVTIDWGDGSPATTGTLSALKGGGGFGINGTHTYQHSGSHEVDVTVVDVAAQTQITIPSTAIISDAPLKITTKAFKTVEKATYQGIAATFTDGNPFAVVTDFTATINWGDGTTSSASGAGGTITLTGKKFNVFGTHSYAEEGQYTATVTVTDVGGSTIAGTLKAAVADAPLIPLPAVTFDAIVGIEFDGVVASFTDSGTDGTADDYTSTITWGDGHVTTASAADNSITVETVNGQAVFHVSGTNTYAKTGIFKVKVVIKDVGKFTTTVQSKAVVN